MCVFLYVILSTPQLWSPHRLIIVCPPYSELFPCFSFPLLSFRAHNHSLPMLLPPDFTTLSTAHSDLLASGWVYLLVTPGNKAAEDFSSQAPTLQKAMPCVRITPRVDGWGIGVRLHRVSWARWGNCTVVGPGIHNSPVKLLKLWVWDDWYFIITCTI